MFRSARSAAVTAFSASALASGGGTSSGLLSCLTRAMSSSSSSSSGWTKSITATSSPSGSSLKLLPSRSSSQMHLHFGQPHPLTHPHLLTQDEVNHCITREEFVERRSKLAEAVLKSDVSAKATGASALLSHKHYADHLIIVSAAQRVFMYDNIPYTFRQNSDYRYLTGSLEPDCVLVIEVRNHSQKSHLFFRDPDPREELWEGPRTRPDQDAADFFGIDECHSFSSLTAFLGSYKREARGEFLLWYDYFNSKSERVHKVVMDFIQNLSTSQGLHSPKKIIHDLRLIKSPAEIALMRESCSLAAGALQNAMKKTRNMSTELELYASVDHYCRSRGAQFLAYPPVVAAGANATIVHYTQSTQALSRSSLVLVDAGCELHGYTSDVTRTWPAGPVFTEPQRALYEATLSAQEELLTFLQNRDAKRTSVDSLYFDIQLPLMRRLEEAGVVRSGALQGADRRMKLRDFCPHHVSHYLGMDVHDSSSADKGAELRPGMIITVEPGVYVPESANPAVVREEFRGIGVRIEDDVLITEGGFEVLSEMCPKTVKEVEELCT